VLSSFGIEVRYLTLPFAFRALHFQAECLGVEFCLLPLVPLYFEACSSTEVTKEVHTPFSQLITAFTTPKNSNLASPQKISSHAYAGLNHSPSLRNTQTKMSERCKYTVQVSFPPHFRLSHAPPPFPAPPVPRSPNWPTPTD
jgi:hypothetical protein